MLKQSKTLENRDTGISLVAQSANVIMALSLATSCVQMKWDEFHTHSHACMHAVKSCDDHDTIRGSKVPHVLCTSQLCEARSERGAASG